MAMNRDNTIALFDVDGTLSAARKQAGPEMLQLLQQLRQRVQVGLVSGSDFSKEKEQMGENLVAEYDYVFAENGLVAFHAGQEIHRANFAAHIGEDRLQDLIDFCLDYISKVRLPFKRGTFIEFRSGMLNVSPVGRACSYDERLAFWEYDKQHGVRKAMVEALAVRFADADLKFSIGGQISLDIFPIGWDKTYCLRHLPDSLTTVHFFGDKTAPGGNDHEIFASDRTIGHTVTGPEDTMKQINELFLG